MKPEQKRFEKNVKRGPLRTSGEHHENARKGCDQETQGHYRHKQLQDLLHRGGHKKGLPANHRHSRKFTWFPAFATIYIIFINIPQIKSPMLQTYVSWGVVQVSWWTQTECLMDDSKLKEPGSPHWPAKQLRGMRLKICLLEGQVTICNRALKIYQKCINHEATTATRTRKMHDATHKKEKYYKDRRTGCKIELKWNMGSMKRGLFSWKWHSNA